MCNIFNSAFIQLYPLSIRLNYNYDFSLIKNIYLARDYILLKKILHSPLFLIKRSFRHNRFIEFNYSIGNCIINVFDKISNRENNENTSFYEQSAFLYT